MKQQDICGKRSAFAYYWPGKPKEFACEEHTNQIRVVGNTIGYPIATEPDTEHICQQVMSNKGGLNASDS